MPERSLLACLNRSVRSSGTRIESGDVPGTVTPAAHAASADVARNGNMKVLFARRKQLEPYVFIGRDSFMEPQDRHTHARGFYVGRARWRGGYRSV